MPSFRGPGRGRRRVLLAVAVLLSLLVGALGAASAAELRSLDEITFGTPVVATVSTPNGSVDLTFSGTAGQKVSLRATATTIANGLIRILRPDGSTLASSANWCCSKGGYIDTQTLPSTGTYTVRLIATNNKSGSATLTLYDVTDDVTGQIVVGTPTSVTVPKPGQRAVLTFEGSTGQRVSFRATTSNMGDANLTIKKPDGTVLNTVRWYTWDGAWFDTQALPATGTYTVLLDPVDDKTGTVVMNLYNVPPDAAGSLEPGVPVTANVTVPGRNFEYTFSGVGGTAVTVKMTTTTVGDANASVRDPGGAVIASARWYTWDGVTFGSLSLPTTGTYKVYLDPLVWQTGTVTVSLGGGSQTKPQTYGSFCDGPGSFAAVACGVMSDPVNTLTGAFVHAETDLALAGTGVPLELTRTYTSADPASGRFGVGWTDTYQASLELLPGGDVLAKGDEGQRLRFTSQGGGAFEGAAGARVTLETVAGGFRLTTNDQLVYEFDAAGKLLSKRDRNGQGVTLAYDGSGLLGTVTDAAGETATFTYAGGFVSGVALSDGRSVSYGYTSGRLTSFTDVRGKQWTYTYDSGGRLATIVDPLGHTQVTNVYDATSGRVTSQSDATSKTTTFAWDAATQTATVTDPNGHVWKDVYANNVLQRRIDGTNKTTEFGFDLELNGTTVKSPAGETTAMTYDERGNMLTATAPTSLASAKKTFVYNERNDPTSVTDARNKVTAYTYTPAGNVETVTQDGLPRATFTYDAAGRVLTATDANNHTTTYAYDAAGNVESVTQPDPDGPGPLGQPITTYTYDSQGNVLTRVDPKGNVSGCGCAAQYTTTFTYNDAGQQLTETDPLGHLSTNVYDDAGRLVSSTDFAGRTTSYTYDNANRVLTETLPDPDGGGPLAAPVTTYAYDNAGNKVSETGPRGNTTTFTYDNANRLASTTAPDPDGGGPLTAPKTTYTYDTNGNLATVVDPRGNVTGANPNDYKTTYTYDAAGRLKTVKDPLGNTTTNVYDAVGNLQSVTNARGYATTYTYDYAGRVLTVTAPDPDGTGGQPAPVTTYTYDPVGNELTRTDAKSHTTTRAYDALNRVVSVTSPDPDGAGAETSSVATTSYDLNSNLASQVDANGNGTGTAGDGTTSYGYDRANRLVSIDYSDTTPDVTYTLDEVGNPVSMTDGEGIDTRVYDSLDRLVTVTRAGESFSYEYDPAGNITKRTYPDGTVVDSTYDPLSRLASVSSGGATTSYGYDPASNLTTTTLPASNGHVETRTYDRAGRLLGVKNSKDTTVLAEIVYTRDAVGNPLTETRTGTAPGSKTFQYDRIDRLTGVCYLATTCPGGSDPFIRWTYDGVGNRLTETRPTGTTNYSYDAMDRMLTAGSTSYSYDRNGNQLTAGTSSFSYDLANRVTSATVAGTVTTYSYDGDGKRLRAAAGAQEANFAWDVTYGLPQLALERDGGNALLRRYFYGRQPISMATSDTAIHYYHYDPLGSVRDITDATGTSEATYDYEPFGAIRSQTGTLDQPLRFTSQYQDSTGLYHLRARQYDPAAGRFLAVDPADQTINGIAISPYVYTGDQPTVMVDPSGTRFFATLAFPRATRLASSRVRFPQSVGGWPRNGTVIGRPGGAGLGLGILAAIAASFSGPGGGPPFNPFKPRNPFGDDNDSARRDYLLHAPPLPLPRIVFNQNDASEGDPSDLDLQKANDRFIEERTGEKAHDIKKEIVGSRGSQYDLYVDKKTGDVYVLRKGGRGEPQPTGLNVRDERS